MGIIEDITSFAYDILPMNMKLKKNGNCRIDKDTDVADKGNYIGVSEKTARMEKKPLYGPWVVFVSVCFVFVTVLSLIPASGTLFPYFLEEFGETRAKTATVLAVFKGVGLCSGFFMGMAVQHFGARKCGVLGGVLFSGGLLLSVFATSVTFLIISFGIISGVGVVALLYLSANQAASACFKGRNALVALSVVTSSVGVGGMFYPYLLQFLIDSYALRGALLIISGISMNAIPLSLLWIGKEDDTLEEECRIENPSAAKHSSGIDVKATVHKKCNIVSEIRRTSLTEPEAFQKSGIINPRTDLAFIRKSQRPKRLSWSIPREPEMMQISAIEVEVKKHLSVDGIAESSVTKNEDKQTFRSQRFLTIKNNLKATFTNKAFLFLLFGLCFAFSSQNMFEILLLDILESCDLQRMQSVTLLIVLNGACIPGRLSSGIIVKIPGCMAVMAAILGSVVAFVGIVLLMFCAGFSDSLVACIFLGLSKGAILGALSVVPLELLGPERFSTGLGVVICIAGICTSVLGPVNGFLRDTSGSYHTSLYVAAGSMCLTTLFCFVTMVIQRKKRPKLIKTIQEISPALFVRARKRSIISINL